MPSTTLPKLSEDELDDVLYFSRIGDLAELKVTIETCAKRFNVPLHDIMLAAIEDGSGNGPLHMASANGHNEILTYTLSLFPSETASSILTLRNASGNTALHWASLNGHLDAVKSLVQAGADPSLTNQAGHDAVYEAELNGQEKVVEWLLTEGKGLDAGVRGATDGGPEDGDGADELRAEVDGLGINDENDSEK